MFTDAETEVVLAAAVRLPVPEGDAASVFTECSLNVH
jgi:hypothetical protein